VLSIHPGHSVDYLTREVATGRENYYTGAVTEGEPPGRWYGAGAKLLGLSGLVDHQDMEALYEHFVDPRDANFRNRDAWTNASKLGHAGRAYKTAEELYAQYLDTEPYADAEWREQLRLLASKNERKNVAFYDVTFSVPKSVTVLHAAFEAQEVKVRTAGDAEGATAWAAHKQAVEDAIWAGNNAALDYLAEHAGYSRVGHHGGSAGRFTDAHDLTVASFFQHTSRTDDPQLHIHNATFARVQGNDGVWRTLDGRSLYLHRPAAGAVGERGMFEHLGRSMRVLAAMRPDGKSREVLGIDQAINDLLSTRRRAITPKTAELVRAFEARYGREPNALELDRLQRHATMVTRPRKSHDGETLEQRLDRIEHRLRAEINVGLDKVAADVLALAAQAVPRAQPFSPAAVIETALADVQARKASWTEADLARAINDALPDYLGGLDAADVHALIRGLTIEAIEQHCVSLTAEGPGTATLPDELRLSNGGAAYVRPGARLYATAEHTRSERALRSAAVERTAVAVRPELAAAYIDGLGEQGVELGVDQAAAVRGALTSAADVESLVGPAGTGKSFVVGVIAQAWQDSSLWNGQQRKAVGLAASQIATEVLADEGLAARNITRWLATQQRLAAGDACGDDSEWRLAAGDLVVVDESAMADTAQLAAIHRVTQDAGVKLLLTGDHYQLAAVGAAGGMDLVAGTGPSYELAEARRFNHAWERAASLRLREGDDSALQDYRKHGRIIDGGTIEQTERAAARAWLADMLVGKRSLLIVDTNEQADRISAQLRAELVRLGRVNEQGVPLNLQGTIAGVGDLVQARRNAWDLAGVFGNRRGPINREHYRVLETRDDGGLIVAPIIGRTSEGEQLGDRITLPGSYVVDHVALGYASTVHSAQGLTVDASHAVATGRTGRAALYVGLSRGREANTAYACTLAVPDEDAPTGAANQITRRDPLAVLATNDERAGVERAAIAEAEESSAEAGSLRAAAERFADVAELATVGRTATMLDRLVDDGVLSPTQRADLAADEGIVSLTRVLRQAEVAGHDPDRVLRDAIASRELGDARSLASVLHHRISDTVDLHPAGDRYVDWTPKVDDPVWRAHLNDLAAIADRRRSQLGHEVAESRPQWAIEAFGPPPEDPAARTAWVKRAAAIAAHRELTGHDDPDIALPGPPKPGHVEAYASWRSAWRELGRDEATRAEAEMSDGQLRMRVRAYEREKAWAPDYVAPELSGTLQAAQRHRTTAELRAAEAEREADARRRAELEREAGESGALADVLNQQAAQLEKADEIRALWYAHTAATRAAEQRARDELGARGVDPDHAEDTATAEQWLAAHRAEQAGEDQHRQITDEADLAEVVDQRDADLRSVEPRPSADAAETNLADIREQAAAQPKRPARTEHDWTRVPSANETADSISRAQRALSELEQRRRIDERRSNEEARARQLTQWHRDDQAVTHARKRDYGAALDRT
jgi:conjugative relaxase-like TrwC/TraI family protein